MAASGRGLDRSALTHGEVCGTDAPLPRGLDAVAWWKERLRGWEYVYVIRPEGQTAIKVGRALDVEARVRGLQTGNPRRLEVLHCIPGDSGTEAEIHRHLRYSRLRGEWFDGPAIPTFLERIAAYSDQLILRFLSDARLEHGILRLDEPPPQRAKRSQLRTAAGSKWRTGTGRLAEVKVRHVEPDPLTPEQSAAFATELRGGRQRPDPKAFGWTA